jgi:Na+/proline symporter
VNSFGLSMIVFSLLLMAAVTYFGYVFSKRTLKNNDSYFTAGRNITTAFMTATFIAYAVGTGLIFSPAESAYLDGVTAMIGYALALSIAYFVFIPVARRIKSLIPQGNTIGEYVKVRYGNTMFVVVLFVIIVYLFCLLASNFIGAGIAFQYLGDIPIYLGVLIIGVPVIFYTTYGGLGAAIFTNAIQALLLTPLLFVTAWIAFTNSGGTTKIYQGIMENSPEFLNVFNPSGIKFAVMIIIAVSAAELLNQALWQRVYSAKDFRVIKKGLINASIMTFPMAIIAAAFGLIAIAMNMDLPHPSIGTALVSHALLPEWASMLFVMVIVLAVTSTGSDSLSAFASTASLDIMKSFFPNMSSENAVKAGRIATIIFGVGAMLVAFKAPSILQLLLLADLVASAAVVPVIAGLFHSKITGGMATAGTILGMIVGLPLFLMGESLYSFLAAIIVSSLIVFIGGSISKKTYNFDRLKEQIKNLD